MFSALLQHLGIGLDYLIAIALIAGGVYLIVFNGAKPFRVLGEVLVAAGCIVGAYTYGQSTGAADCEARWQAANYQAQIDAAKRDAAAQKAAADEAEKQRQKLESDYADAQQQLDAFRKAVAGGPACRQPTPDDVRRVCQLTGNTAPGCRPAK